MLTILSLGAGVQSTTLALMAAHGEIGPMPDCAIFADTEDEKRATYRHLDWLESVLPFPVRRIRRYNISLSEATLRHYRSEPGGLPFTPPFYSPAGKLPTYCSKEWKTRAVINEVRAMCGLLPRQRAPKGLRVEVWIGITTDEAHRMKPCEAPWIKNRWPLLELRKHRRECATWLARNGYPMPPRSACKYCPWMSDDEFAAMEPDDFAEAVTFDAAIRDGGNGTEGPLYVSRHMRPLGEIDFVALAAAKRDVPDLFGDECEGMCGV